MRWKGSEPAGIRTQDTRIKSPMLCQTELPAQGVYHAVERFSSIPEKADLQTFCKRQEFSAIWDQPLLELILELHRRSLL